MRKLGGEVGKRGVAHGILLENVAVTISLIAAHEESVVKLCLPAIVQDGRGIFAIANSRWEVGCSRSPRRLNIHFANGTRRQDTAGDAVTKAHFVGDKGVWP